MMVNECVAGEDDGRSFATRELSGENPNATGHACQSCNRLKWGLGHHAVNQDAAASYRGQHPQHRSYAELDAHFITLPPASRGW